MSFNSKFGLKFLKFSKILRPSTESYLLEAVVCIQVATPCQIGKQNFELRSTFIHKNFLF